MRTTLTLLLTLFFHNQFLAQTITVGGQCMGSNITLSKIADVNGRSAYQGTGTVSGIAGVTVSVYWLTPENVWVLDFDGQPFYYESCNTSEPTGTADGACPWSEVDPGACTGAAPLYVSGVASLPVELVSFTAHKNNNNGVDVKWTTSSESNNKGFEIQRSTDALNWSAVGFVNGKGNSTIENHYQFSDRLALSGKNYYRLVQVDFDGNKKHSFVASVDLPQNAFYIVANNPGKGIYQIRIASNEKVELSVLDLSGHRILNKIVGIGIHEIDISRFAAGTYLLQLKRGKELITKKLVKH